MKRNHSKRARGVLAVAAGLSLIAAACGSDASTGKSSSGGSTPAAGSSGGAATTPASSGGKVVINWWHIQNNDPAKTNWQKMADAYTAQHPNVEIKINAMENEAFKAALQTNLQAGDVPDLFQSWGGGGLREQVYCKTSPSRPPTSSTP
jgi:raffinose/stachyose/melibiose transport system substrate-binding protein